MMNKKYIETDINKRWELGMDHHPRSYAVQKTIRELDEFGVYEFGGDGDNGEDILYMLDVYFEREDANEV